MHYKYKRTHRKWKILRRFQVRQGLVVENLEREIENRFYRVLIKYLFLVLERKLGG